MLPWFTEVLTGRVAADAAYQNARQNSDLQNARIEHDKALARLMTAVLPEDTELFKPFMVKERFRRWMTGTVFGLTFVAWRRTRCLEPRTDNSQQRR